MIAEAGYVPALRRLEGIEIAAVADPSVERRRTVAALAVDSAPVREYRGAEELIRAGGVDGVVVASPPECHVADAELASAAELPCLVEKPPAPHAAGASRLAALRPAPWIGFNRRFMHAAALAALPGAAAELELEIRYRRRSWRAHEVRDDALLDLGPHLVDLALVGLQASEASVQAASSSPERAELVLAAGERRARIRCATDRPYAERLTARDAEGGVLASSHRGGALRNALLRMPGAEHPLLSSLRDQVVAFAAVVAGRPAAMPAMLATAADGARTMRLIDAALHTAAR